MASKNRHGLEIYDLLIGLVLSLSPLQAENLYTELLPKYTKRSHTKLYNEYGDPDPHGKIRLTEYQYKAIRTKFGDTYMRRAFKELTDYIIYLERNADSDTRCKAKLKTLNSKTHNAILATEDGWVYNKHKSYVCTERPLVSVNPYLIDDFATAKE